ncbi:DNA/RNA non-specific endonuclease [Williamwhitmania taraxaci]|uniref:Endonuclease G n=1 Tax=Williamwhitmania taraxaci TaxID=1640674 RepID=A0A1G6LBK2_9BACT|nr:DNA/RNA non-specific endonuclease [Williamwhitmania taraxaci]SDC40513.1 endonuclease G [Williamwhitmania taraxaci]
MWKKIIAGSALLLFISVVQNNLFSQEVSVNKTVTRATAVSESFDSGVKNYYAAGTIAGTAGSWYVEEGLLGYSPRDQKVGAKAVRLRDAGILRMAFDFADGIDVVTISHGAFGTDAAGKWELYSSINAGADWVKVGSTITTTAIMGSSAISVNIAGNVRLEIRKVDGTESRIDFDEISVTSYVPPVDPGDTTPSREDNMALGNPSGAAHDETIPNNYLMVKNEYALSYNRDKGTANWTSWHLSSAWVGATDRTDKFTGDLTLPTGWFVVGDGDYSGSGFDRGHLCPSGDRTFSIPENESTFLMTNMMPQAPYNNQQPWRLLEDYCRTLASAGNELYIIAGPAGQGGIGSNGGITNTLVGGKVVVPAYTWKIILVIPNGQNDVARIRPNTRVIAIWMPNTHTGLTTAWGNWRTSVDFIESQTGFDFLSEVPVAVQAVIEAAVDNGAVK